MLSNSLTKQDVPEIKTATITYRDDLKKHLDDLEKYLKDGKPIPKFKGNIALEEALREPRGLRPYEVDNLKRTDLPLDLVRAIVSLWQK